MLDKGLAVCLLFLPLIVLGQQGGGARELNGLDRVVLRVAAPVQAAVSFAIGGGKSWWTQYVGVVGAERENLSLREEVSGLRVELLELGACRAREERLRRLSGFREAQHPRQSTAARVVAAPVSPFFRVVRLRLEDVGPLVSLGMPVVVPEGLVGRIESVYGDYADVMLLSDARSSVDVKIKRTGLRGLLTGLSRNDDQAARIEYVARGSDVAVGDLVVTSGLGGVFPEGVPAGRVVRVASESQGLYREAEVGPVVQLHEVLEVLILGSRREE